MVASFILAREFVIATPCRIGSSQLFKKYLPIASYLILLLLKEPEQLVMHVITKIRKHHPFTTYIVAAVE